jgi:hypothetical protein
MLSELNRAMAHSLRSHPDRNEARCRAEDMFSYLDMGEDGTSSAFEQEWMTECGFPPEPEQQEQVGNAKVIALALPDAAARQLLTSLLPSIPEQHRAEVERAISLL